MKIPMAGVMRAGTITPLKAWESRLPTLAHVDWPTPERSDGSGGRVAKEMGGKRPSGAKRAVTLATKVVHAEKKLWPTPSARDGPSGPGTSPKREGGLNLRTAVKLWPTPQARDGMQRGAQPKRFTNPERSNDLDDAVAYYEGRTGSLNPNWVEWLLGWDGRWTILEEDPSATTPIPDSGSQVSPPAPPR